MNMLSVILILVAATMTPPEAVQAPEHRQADQRQSDQRRAFDAARAGRILPPRTIEARVLPMMKDYQYLGFDLDFGSGIYTLKFLRDGNVVWVEVDGRSGQMLGRTGK